MATRDLLKYFSDYDGYSGNLTKAEMDENLKVLADKVDEAKVFNYSEGVITPVDSDINIMIDKNMFVFNGFNIDSENQRLLFYGFNLDAANYSMSLGGFNVNENGFSHQAFSVDNSNYTLSFAALNIDASSGALTLAGFSVNGSEATMNLGNFNVNSENLTFGQFNVNMELQLSLGNIYLDGINNYIMIYGNSYFEIDATNARILFEKDNLQTDSMLINIETTDSNEVVVTSIPINKHTHIKIFGQVSNADNSKKWIFEKNIGAFDGDSELSFDEENSFVKNDDNLECNAAIEDENIVIKVKGIDDTLNWYFKIETLGVNESK